MNRTKSRQECGIKQLQSNTTKSRLNAILREHGCPGECVFQQNFTWFVSMKNAKGEDLKVPFFSGMRLN